MSEKQIEQHNIKTFKKYGTSQSSINRFYCTECKKPTCIDCSMSNKGHKLICNSCVYRVYGSMEKAFKWVYE